MTEEWDIWMEGGERQSGQGRWRKEGKERQKEVDEEEEINGQR